MSAISATKARMHLGEMIDEIDRDGEPIVVETDDQPRIVLLTPDEYAGLEKRERWRQFLERRDELAEQFQRELGGRPQPDWDRYIREGREER
jgi:PHD/YefM family antitoxin component YafN of YafNO toxin-antitoxin module